MRVLLSIIFSTMGAVANVSVVLMIVIYICAIIGMQLFGENYVPANFPDGVPRWNFVDFPHSIMLVFRILCGEWIEPLYDCMNCSNTGLCILVFITTLIVGNILVSYSIIFKRLEGPLLINKAFLSHSHTLSLFTGFV